MTFAVVFICQTHLRDVCWQLPNSVQDQGKWLLSRM